MFFSDKNRGTKTSKVRKSGSENENWESQLWQLAKRRFPQWHSAKKYRLNGVEVLAKDTKDSSYYIAVNRALKIIQKIWNSFELIKV
jgi:hypothetical protein